MLADNPPASWTRPEPTAVTPQENCLFDLFSSFQFAENETILLKRCEFTTLQKEYFRIDLLLAFSSSPLFQDSRAHSPHRRNLKR